MPLQRPRRDLVHRRARTDADASRLDRVRCRQERTGRSCVVAGAVAVRAPAVERQAGEDEQILTVRGERGVFRVPAADLLRLRWNPFYDYYERRILQMIQSGSP